MALNKDVLGLARYTAEMAFNNREIADLVMSYGSLENARLAWMIMDSDIIIKHFIAFAQLTVPGTGLSSPSGAVAGIASTGKIS